MKWELFILFLFIGVLPGTFCPAQKTEFTSPPGYNLRKPEVIKLPRSLNEISGIHYNASDHSVFAIEDDLGLLFKIPLKQDPEIEQWKYAKKGDYEEVVLTDNRFYVLISHGAIVTFPFEFPIQETRTIELVSGSKRDNEFEILYKDLNSDRLIMICKSCKNDGHRKVSAYAFDIKNQSFEKSPVMTLDVTEIENKLGRKTGRFKPSSANVHPLTGDVFIISSINKLLVITDRLLNVKEVHELDPVLFKQPEGLCFTPGGDLIISNEASFKGRANILYYKFNPR
jgi:hypothetical protein